MPRILFGPCDDASQFDRFFRTPIDDGQWVAFHATTPSWEAALQNCSGSRPDAVVVWPSYASVPSWVWSAPVPVVMLAADANLLWNGYRYLLPLADLVLTDAPSADRLRRAGNEHVRAANLFGLDRYFAASIDEPEIERDLDVVFVGNMSSAVQRERLPWLGRLARLADRFQVRVASGVFGADYLALLRRAKLVFNRSIRGECNLRALEAAASGAVLLQEAENEEVKEYLQPGVEYAPYTAEDFETVVARLLANADERHAIAEAAKDRARWLTFEALLRVALAVGGRGWGEVKERARERIRRTKTVPLLGRVWQRASLSGPDADRELAADVEAAGDPHSRAVLSRVTTEAEPYLTAAAKGGNRVSAMSLAAILVERGRTEDAIAALKSVLMSLAEKPELTPVEVESVPYPLRFDWLRVGWERAGYDHAGDTVAEREQKTRLLRGRACELLAHLTGDVHDWEVAVACCPELPHFHAALGVSFVRAGKPIQAVNHLRKAIEKNPFDNAAAKTLFTALHAAGQSEQAEQLRDERRLLATAAPKLVTEIEDIAAPTPPGETQPPPVSIPTVVIPTVVESTETAEAAFPSPSVLDIAPHAVTLEPMLPKATILAPVTPQAQPTPPNPVPSSRPRPRLQDMSAEAFATRFGQANTAMALIGFTPAIDTQAILTLLAHARPRRVLEIGTANGHMTANLTAFTSPETVVYSLGIVAEDNPHSGTPQQNYEVPRRDEFAKFVNHFGTAHKARLVTADSRTFDFTQLAPLDFVFVDGGHDLATARSDSLATYHALRPGGFLVWHDVPSSVPWVKVEEALTALAFPERIHKIAGTQVAFLIKGEGVGATASSDSGRVALKWEGEFDTLHSLALVNRMVCTELATRGNDVAVLRGPTRTIGATPLPLPAELHPFVGRELPGAVHVRHRWPADFTPPTGPGVFVLMMPWEHGRIPRDWVEPIHSTVDEVWVYSRAMLRAYVASGIPESRVAIVPLGVDTDCFKPGLDPLPLPTTKSVKLLYVGGTIARKGFDVLLAAYGRAFTHADDVCLVVKDLGAGSFYRQESAGDAIRAMRNDPSAPEIVYLTDDLDETDLPRLHAACDALVLPYRGEGFGLSALEAMACGLPVVVTAGGPTDEFVPQSACWRIPARLRYFPEEAYQRQPTVGKPWWLEPDADALAVILKDVVGNADERQRRGRSARKAALGWSWARTATVIEDRVRVLRTRTPVRFQRRPTPTPPTRAIPLAAEALSAPPAFSPAITLRSDVPFVVGGDSTAKPSRPRPSGNELASLIILCCNELDVTRLCIESVRTHTRPPYELILINNASTDGTAAYLNSLVGQSGPERVEVIHNAENRGYPAGVNQGLAAARGEYIVLLNNDVVVTPRWLDRLVRCASHDWPNVGLVGPTTNYAPPPQLVEPPYKSLNDLDAFANKRATEFASQAMDATRLTGFCLLVRRDVFDQVGKLDESFGLGFFDDDDLCLRARRAGFRLALTLDCYVHHFGSRTFRGLGVNTEKQLRENLALYQAKWGVEEAAKYSMVVNRNSTQSNNSSPKAPRVTIPAVAGKPRVSLTMIVKNEEKNLPDCLASVRDLVDEAVVIDTGSTDRTREIATRFGCVLGEFPWIDHFAAARNAALDKATGDYAFWMDADDRLDADNRTKLKTLFESLPSGNTGYVMKCLCVGEGASATGTAVDHVRLFRLHPAHRWTYRVHEQILPSLRTTGADVQWSDVCVRHVGYVDPAVRRRKLDRDLRLLKLDEAEKPSDPFTLFNLGSIYHELGDFAAGVTVLEKSLAGSHVKDSIVRKTFALLARCQHHGGDRRKAEATCRQGRQHYPDDAELLFLAAGLAREGGELGTAEELYRKLIDGSESQHFASVDTGLRSVKGRHNLAVMLLDQHRLTEAEGLWRAALSHDPHFRPAEVGLGEVYVKANNQAGLQRQVATLEALDEAGAAEAAVLLARWQSAQGNHTAAVTTLQTAIEKMPRALGLRVALSHIHIAADSPADAMEAAFRGVLEVDPRNTQAKYNLEVLYRKTGKWVEGVLDGIESNPPA